MTYEECCAVISNLRVWMPTACQAAECRITPVVEIQALYNPDGPLRTVEVRWQHGTRQRTVNGKAQPPEPYITRFRLNYEQTDKEGIERLINGESYNWHKDVTRP